MLKKVSILLLALVPLLFSASALAKENIHIVTAPEVKQMLEKENVVLVNALSAIEFKIQHIPGSINVPVVEMEKSDKLPKDKNQKLVFYCMGKKCKYSEKASKKAVKMGYTNVHWFRGGIPEWRRFNYEMWVDNELNIIKVKKLKPAEINELRKDKNLYVLDVRPLWWHLSDAALENSHFIPLVNLHEKYQSIPKDRPILIVDGLMKQSPGAAKYLSSKGYNVVGVMKGGIMRWVKDNQPSVKRVASK